MGVIPIMIVDRTSEHGAELADKIKSVNLHITKACNYKCSFCYARFNQVGNHLSIEKWKQILFQLASNGTKKITFVGGEPTLVPYLQVLVIYAKQLGMTTMVVTNGTKITDEYLEGFRGTLDWVGLSIDSSKEEVSKQLGRGKGDHVAQTIFVAKLLEKYLIALKVNTVVTSLNWDEDMGWLIKKLSPKRWKVFQMLPIEGENDDANSLQVTKEQFLHFIERHKELSPVAESNEDMLESYVMIDPMGRFFTNAGNKLTHGRSILAIGVAAAFNDVVFKLEKFQQRGGEYDWEVKR